MAFIIKYINSDWNSVRKANRVRLAPYVNKWEEEKKAYIAGKSGIYKDFFDQEIANKDFFPDIQYEKDKEALNLLIKRIEEIAESKFDKRELSRIEIDSVALHKRFLGHREKVGPKPPITCAENMLKNMLRLHKLNEIDKLYARWYIAGKSSIYKDFFIKEIAKEDYLEREIANKDFFPDIQYEKDKEALNLLIKRIEEIDVSTFRFWELSRIENVSVDLHERFLEHREATRRAFEVSYVNFGSTQNILKHLRRYKLKEIIALYERWKAAYIAGKSGISKDFFEQEIAFFPDIQYEGDKEDLNFLIKCIEEIAESKVDKRELSRIKIDSVDLHERFLGHREKVGPKPPITCAENVLKNMLRLHKLNEIDKLYARWYIAGKSSIYKDFFIKKIAKEDYFEQQRFFPDIELNIQYEKDREALNLLIKRIEEIDVSTVDKRELSSIENVSVDLHERFLEHRARSCEVSYVSFGSTQNILKHLKRYKLKEIIALYERWKAAVSKKWPS
jgi:hypothetical protein